MNTETDQSTSSMLVHDRKFSAWFDPRQRGLGMLAFVLNRITAIGLVLYLALHLVVLSLLALGESTWDAFIAIVRSPIILILDVVLIAGVLIHGLNGIRLTLVGLGIAVTHQKILFVIFMTIALGILIVAGAWIFMI